MKSFYILILTAAISCSLFAQQKPINLAKPDSKNVVTVDDLEKIYLQTDKSTYLKSDTIWFKTYLIHVTDHQPSTKSGLVHIEFINPSTGEIIKRQMLPTEQGQASGFITLANAKIKNGNYVIRAYTKWMQNFGTEYFFTKTISILDELVARSDTKTNIENSVQPDVDLQFLPEGGKWLSGISQRIAFKAINALGKGIAVHGQIIDSKDQPITNFESNQFGMGSIFMIGNSNESYYAKIENYPSIKKIALPKVVSNSYVIQVNNFYKRDTIKVNIFSTVKDPIQLTIQGNHNGKHFFSSPVVMDKSMKSISIPRNQCPPGIIQISLINQNQQIVSERNFFNRAKSEFEISIKTDSIFYPTRGTIPLKIAATRSDKTTSLGVFSVVVTDDYQVSKNPEEELTALSYFLLRSELKGEIESPNYYFINDTEKSHADLDVLLLTQGWVNHQSNLKKEISFKAETDFTIEGKVIGMLRKPISNANLTLLGKSSLILQTVANEQGEFAFNDFPPLDSASIIIQSLNKKNNKGLSTIEIEEQKIPPFKPVIVKKGIIDKPIDSIQRQLLVTKEEEKKINIKNGLILNEVTITGKRTVKGSKNLNGPGEADVVLTPEELNPVQKKSIFEILYKQFRGFTYGLKSELFPKDFFFEGRLLKFSFDGHFLDKFYTEDEDYYTFIRSFLDNIHAEDVAGIELIKSYKYSLKYATKDTPVFIEITTKAGNGPFIRNIPNMYRINTINYANTKTFYQPKYTSQNRNSVIPDFRSTLYWEPSIYSNEKGVGEATFYSSDRKGKYTVWVEGTDLNGNFGFQMMKVSVK